MSVPSTPGSPTSRAPKKGVSPARNLIGLVVLLALVAVVWLEYSAHFGYNGAVKALEARTQDEEKGLMNVQEAETLLGKSPDGPGIDVEDNGRTFTKNTYTWRALLRPQTLTAFYTKEATPHLHHFETQGAKYVDEPNAPGARGTIEAPRTRKSSAKSAPETAKSEAKTAPESSKPETKTAPDTSKPETKTAPESSKPETKTAPDTAKSPTKKE